jgi:hypothetical protein
LDPVFKARAKEMKMKKLGAIVCLALGIAVFASPVAQGSPVGGIWTGLEKKYWTGSKWQPYSETPSFSFRIEHGAVAGFNSSSSYQWPKCTGGDTVSTKLPTTRKAKVRYGRFRGARTTYVDGRRMTTYFSGHFTSPRRARGGIVVKLAGCPPYRSQWTAESGTLGGFHIPICRGSNIVMPDGSNYYNPCAYIAKRS